MADSCLRVRSYTQVRPVFERTSKSCVPRKRVWSLAVMLSFSSLAVIGITWSLFGYSLAFGPPISPSFDGLGGLAFGFFDSSNRVRAGTSIPEHAYFEFQGAFATITAAVVSGGVAGRIRLWAWCLFAAIWNLIVYVPLARWVFYEDGWLARLGVLDFAGGLVVEMASGVSAFVLAFWLGPGQTLHGGSHGAHQPHSLPLVLIGAGLLFFGWFGKIHGEPCSIAECILDRVFCVAQNRLQCWKRALCRLPCIPCIRKHSPCSLLCTSILGPFRVDLGWREDILQWTSKRSRSCNWCRRWACRNHSCVWIHITGVP